MQSGTGTACPGAKSGVATAKEVEDAIQQLTKADYLRLVKAARLLVAGSAYATPKDLVNEAVLTPYQAALGQGGRRWPKHVDFMSYLIMTMRGLASDSRGSADRRLTMSHLIPTRHGTQERDVFDDLQFSTPSPEQAIVHAEDEEQSRQADDSHLAMINDRFKDDAHVQWIIRGIKEKKSPSEIQELSGMSKTQYESAQRKWRRGLEKLFPDRSDP